MAREGCAVRQAEEYSVAEAGSGPELQELVSRTSDHGPVAWHAGAAGDNQDRNQQGCKSAAHEDLDTYLETGLASRFRYVDDIAATGKDDETPIEMHRFVVRRSHRGAPSWFSQTWADPKQDDDISTSGTFTGSLRWKTSATRSWRRMVTKEQKLDACHRLVARADARGSLEIPQFLLSRFVNAGRHLPAAQVAPRPASKNMV